MKVTIAKIISYVLNPLTVLVFVPFFVISRTTNDLQGAIGWTVYTLLFLMIVAGVLFYGVWKKVFVDLDVSKREQRPLLFKVCGILLAIYLFGLYIFQAPEILVITTIGVIIGVFIISLVNMKIKASLHVATVSAFIFALALVYQGAYVLLLLLIPLVAWARVTTKRHTLKETIVGGTLGILLSLGMYIFIKFIYV